MPESFRTGFYDHLCRIHAPRVTEYEETGFQETFRKVIGQCTFFAVSSQILDELVFRKHFAPITVVFQHRGFRSQLCVAEAWICVIGERHICIEYNHLLDCIKVGLREFITESVQICYIQCLAEDVDSGEVIVRVKLKLAAVIVYLYINLTIHDVYAALSPSCRFFELRKERTGINHALRFKQ